MKAVFTLIFILSFLSCSTEENKKPQNLNLNLAFEELPQQWKLVKMTGSLTGSESTGDKMSWQETYSFFKDHTFIKTRINEQGVTLTASGSFRVAKEIGTVEKS